MSIELPIDEKEFIQHCKARLSFLKINVTPDQEKIAYQRAKKKFLEYHRDSTEMVYVKQQIQAQDLQRGYFTTPDEIYEVHNLLSYRAARSFTNNMIYDMEIKYSLYNSGNSGFSVTEYDRRESPIISYWLYRMDSGLYQSHFNRDDLFTWSKTSRRLVVQGNPNFHEGEYIVYEASKSLEDEERFYQCEWFMDYYTAVLKKTWGENLTKFSNVELPGGMTLNGQGFKDEAKAEIEALEEELITTYSDYTMIYVS